MNILLADDHCLFLEGLKHLIKRLYPTTIITEATNGIDTLALASRDNEFDLALIDLRLPGIDGFTILKHLNQISSLLPVLIVSSSEDPDDINEAFNLCACGFVSKSFTPEELQHAISTVLEGGIYMPETSKKDKLTPCWAKQHQITHRQLEVLRLTKKGRLNNEIADTLYITERTVKAHISSLFESFQAKSRTELVHKAN